MRRVAAADVVALGRKTRMLVAEEASLNRLQRGFMKRCLMVSLVVFAQVACTSYKDDVRQICNSAEGLSADKLTRKSFKLHLDRLMGHVRTPDGVKLVAGFSGVTKLEDCGGILKVAATKDVSLESSCRLASLLMQAGKLRERDALVAKGRIRDLLKTTTPAANQCLEAARKGSPDLAGRMVLRVKIDDEDTNIRRAAESHIRNEALERCLSTAIKKAIEPARPTGGRALVIHHAYDFEKGR